MPIILATQEAEVRRIVVLSQAQANSSQDLISKKPFIKIGLVVKAEFKPQYCQKINENLK
jgi:hypothetical protein